MSEFKPEILYLQYIFSENQEEFTLENIPEHFDTYLPSNIWEICISFLKTEDEDIKNCTDYSHTSKYFIDDLNFIVETSIYYDGRLDYISISVQNSYTYEDLGGI